MIEKSLLSVLVGASPRTASALCFCGTGSSPRAQPEGADAVCWRLPGQLSRGCHLLAALLQTLLLTGLFFCCCTCALWWAVTVPAACCMSMNHMALFVGLPHYISLLLICFLALIFFFYTLYGGKCISLAVIPYFFH